MEGGQADPSSGSGTSGPQKGPDGPGTKGSPDTQLRGRKPGDRRIRVERPQSEYFRYGAEGTLVARPKAHEETRPVGRAMAFSRRVLFGRPLASDEEINERLSKTKALATEARPVTARRRPAPVAP